MTQDNKQNLITMIIVIIVTAFVILSYGCTSTPAEPVQIESPAPDFYDRLGNACWRLSDLIWCEDGYGSWEDKRDRHDQAATQE